MANQLNNSFLTLEEKQIYKEFFDECDLDSDGSINKEEFEIILSTLCVSKKDIEKAFLVFDQSHDGKISFDEFLNQLLTVSIPKLEKELKQRKLVETKIAMYNKYFNRWDKDSDGNLNKEEFKTLLKQRNTPKDHIDFVHFDTNKDGTLTFEEFFNFLQKTQPK